MTDMSLYVENLTSEFELTEFDDDGVWTRFHLEDCNNTPSSFNYSIVKKLQEKLLLAPTASKITIELEDEVAEMYLYVYLKWVREE